MPISLIDIRSVDFKIISQKCVTDSKTDIATGSKIMSMALIYISIYKFG